METDDTLRKVPHPKRIYIQVNDEDTDTFSFSINDDYGESVGIDPNELDDESLERCEDMFGLLYMLIRNKRKKGERIESIKE